MVASAGVRSWLRLSTPASGKRQSCRKGQAAGHAAGMLGCWLAGCLGQPFPSLKPGIHQGPWPTRCSSLSLGAACTGSGYSPRVQRLGPGMVVGGGSSVGPPDSLLGRACAQSEDDSSGRGEGDGGSPSRVVSRTWMGWLEVRRGRCPSGFVVIELVERGGGGLVDEGVGISLGGSLVWFLLS